MRKAFDANVPKLKPRLRGALQTAGEQVAQEEMAEAPRLRAASGGATLGANGEIPGAAALGANGEILGAAAPVASGVPGGASLGDGEIPAAPVAPVAAPRERRAVPPSSPVAQEPPQNRRERLDKIKRKVAEAARPAPRLDPAPADPARAAESVLSLVRDLEGELEAAREREAALRSDLSTSQTELARAAAEARGSAEKLAVAERQLDEKRGVLTELLAEMNALEEERDESVRRAQALSALDEERARLLDDLSQKAEEEGRLRAERDAEVERLSEELRTAGTEGARLRAGLAEVARERDELSLELARVRKERDDLASAKRALEQVHAALAQARARLG